MRAALALVTTLAGTVVGVAGLASPATATTSYCAPPPPPPHVVLSSIEVTHVDCGTAHNVVNDYMHLRPLHGWSCSAHSSGRSMNVRCHKSEHPTHTVFWVYRPNFSS